MTVLILLHAAIIVKPILLRRRARAVMCAQTVRRGPVQEASPRRVYGTSPVASYRSGRVALVRGGTSRARADLGTRVVPAHVVL